MNENRGYLHFNVGYPADYMIVKAELCLIPITGSYNTEIRMHKLLESRNALNQNRYPSMSNALDVRAMQTNAATAVEPGVFVKRKIVHHSNLKLDHPV